MLSLKFVVNKVHLIEGNDTIIASFEDDSIEVLMVYEGLKVQIEGDSNVDVQVDT